MEKLKLGIVGSGFLGGIIAKAWKDGYLPEYELVGIAGRNEEKTKNLAAETGCRPCADVDELLLLKPDYIAEAASGQAVRDMALKVLEAGTNLIVLSIGAFADTAFYEKTKETAAANGTKVYIASGAVGGFDVLRTVSLMGEAAAGLENRKAPKGFKDTPLFAEHLLTDTESTEVFSGSAREAIELLPTKVNVAVAASLVTVGPEKTTVNIHSVPGMVGDVQKITSEIEGVKAVVDIYSSTSAIAGWSVVAVLQNIVSPIVF